jgi:hypothetical protein
LSVGSFFLAKEGKMSQDWLHAGGGFAPRALRIGIIGGVERSEPAYRELAEAAGHVLAFHSGHVTGRGSAALADLVRSADFLIVVTDVNSHGAVQLARRLARRNRVALVLQRRFRPGRFAALLAELGARPQAEAQGGAG